MYVYTGESSASSDVSMMMRCVGDCMDACRLWRLPPPPDVEKRRAFSLKRSILLTYG